MSDLSIERLEERLRMLAATGTPDWPDVHRRARGPGRGARRRRIAVLAAAVLILLAAVATALGLGSRLLDLLSVSRSDRAVPRVARVEYVAGDRLYRPGRSPLRLAAPLFAPLLGTDAPLAVRSPNRRYVAYHTWSDRTPSLRLIDLRVGRDSLLARGAQSVAWQRRVAYVRGAQAKLGRGAYLGQVVVADGPGEREVVWATRPAAYRVAAWAGSTLLIEMDPCLSPACGRAPPVAGAYAIDGPDRMRPLSLSSVAAVSPDGRFVVGPHPRVRGQDSPSSIVHVDDVRSGRTVASIDLVRAARGRAPGAWLSGGLETAAWREDTIAGISTVGRISVLVVLRFDGRRLRLERVLRLDAPGRAGVSGALRFSNPIFLGSGTRKVLVQLFGPLGGGRYLAAALTCDRVTRRCVRGRAQRQRRWFAVVGNPSRPLR